MCKDWYNCLPINFLKITLSTGDKNNIYLCSKLKALEIYQNSLIVLSMLVLLWHSLLKVLLNESIWYVKREFHFLPLLCWWYKIEQTFQSCYQRFLKTNKQTNKLWCPSPLRVERDSLWSSLTSTGSLLFLSILGSSVSSTHLKGVWFPFQSSIRVCFLPNIIPCSGTFPLSML